MHWIAPSETNSSNGSLEKSLWKAADQFRANSGLKSQEYSAPFDELLRRIQNLRTSERRFYQKAMKRKTRHPRTRGPTRVVGVNKMADGLPCANGASTHQPRATPWELVPQNNHQP